MSAEIEQKKIANNKQTASFLAEILEGQIQTMQSNGTWIDDYEKKSLDFLKQVAKGEKHLSEKQQQWFDKLAEQSLDYIPTQAKREAEKQIHNEIKGFILNGDSYNMELISDSGKKVAIISEKNGRKIEPAFQFVLTGKSDLEKSVLQKFDEIESERNDLAKKIAQQLYQSILL